MKHKTLPSGFLVPVIILFVWNAGFTIPESSVQQGGSILGIVVPFSVKTNILVVSVSDTIAHTYSDTTNGAYILKDIPPATMLWYLFLQITNTERTPSGQPFQKGRSPLQIRSDC